MKKEIVKVVATIGVVTTLTIGGATLVHSKIEYEVEKAKIEYKVEQDKSIDEENNKILDTYYENIIEKNKSTLELIVFDSDYSKFEQTVQEDAFMNPVEMDIKLEYKYKASVDLSKATVTRVENKNLIIIPNDAIKVSSIEYGKQTIVADTNLFNRFKGKTIEELSNTILKSSKQTVNEIVQLDFDKRYYNIINNLQKKLEFFYGQEGQYMEVIVNEK